jgi:hypothetical protein
LECRAVSFATRRALFFLFFLFFSFFVFFSDGTRRDFQRKRIGVARREIHRGVAHPRGAAEVARAHGQHDSVRLVDPGVPLDRGLSRSDAGGNLAVVHGR